MNLLKDMKLLKVYECALLPLNVFIKLYSYAPGEIKAAGLILAPYGQSIHLRRGMNTVIVFLCKHTCEPK